MRQKSFPRHPAATARRTRLLCEQLEDRAQPSVLSFRTAQDTEISAFAPVTPGGTNALLHVESGAGGPTRQALIRFHDLFGPGPGQIPPGSTINAASLALWVGAPALSPSGAIALHRMTVAWDPATAIWIAFGGDGVQATGSEALAAADGAIAAPTASGYQIIGGLRDAVRAWAGGANNGWVVLAAGPSQGWSINSADAPAADRRPLLTVDYTPPNAPANPTYQQLVGAPPALSDAAWFTWEAALQAQRLARVPAERAATYYFAQAGDDVTGTGALDRPWKTLAKAQAVLSASAGDVRLRFQGGDTWREATRLLVEKGNVTLDSYGGGTALFTAFTTRYTTGWVRVSGDLWKRAELTSLVGWVREGADTVYPFRHVYTRTNSSASVAATAYSFYHDVMGADLNSGGALTLYLNAGPGVDPNALPGGFEAAPFAGGWTLSGDNVRLENVRLHGYGMNVPGTVGATYGVYIAGSAWAEVVLVNVDVFYTGYHAIGNVGSLPNILTCVGCRAGLCTTTTFASTSVFVGYSNDGWFEDVWADNEIGYGALPDYSWAAAPGRRNGVGFFDHTAGLGAAGLIVALRTRYPDHPWQVATSSWVGAAPAGRIEDVRAFVVGERPAVGIVPELGLTGYTVALADCQYDLGAFTGIYGVTLGVWVQFCRFWAYNCSFRIDASNTPNFNFGWFFGAGNAVGPICVNCRFDMVVPRGQVGSIITSFNTPVAATTTFQNCAFGFLGVGRAVRGSPDLTGAKLDHNAYYAEMGGVADFLNGDPAGVILDRPAALGRPSLTSPLRAAGAINGLNYDQTGAVRPAGPRDIGPLAAQPLPTPAAVSVGWGHRTAVVNSGTILSAAGLDRVSLTFAADVDVRVDSLTVSGNNGNYAFRAFGYNPATRTATWTLAVPVGADRLSLTLEGRAVGTFGVLPGDVTGDGAVTRADVLRVRAGLGTNDPTLDVNGDGIVGPRDYMVVLRSFGLRI